MTQEGGAVYSFQMLLNNIDSPAKLIYGFIVVLVIVYSSEIPSDYKLFMDSILGRVFGIAIIYGVIQSLGWVYGLLTALAFLLIMNGVNRSVNQSVNQSEQSERVEGFQSTDVSYKNRWYVEKVLKERPSEINIHEDITTAIHS